MLNRFFGVFHEVSQGIDKFAVVLGYIALFIATGYFFGPQQ